MAGLNADVEFDEWCDPNNPRKIQYDGVVAAARRVMGAVVRTPCTRARMSDKLGIELFLKQEFLQYTGSFKERGVRNTLMNLTDEQRKNGVISASSGNHALALVYHTSLLEIPSVVYMPTSAAKSKTNKCIRLGGKVVLYGANLAEAKRQAMSVSKEKKMMYINGYDHPNIVEGQGTIGLEVLEQVPDVDAILVPCGGGSLLAGIATAIKHVKPDTEVYGIETDRTASMVESLKKNERIAYPLDYGRCLADGLAVNTVGVNTFHTIKGLIDKMVVVKEDWLSPAILRLIEDEKFIVEGAGATGLAAIMAGLFPNLKGKKVVTVLSGGNIDTTVISHCIERGMASEGRLIKFHVSILNRPGGLAELVSLLSNMGINIIECVPDKALIKQDVFSINVLLLVETQGWDHVKELQAAIKKIYKDFYFEDINDKGDKSTRRGPCLAPNPVCMQK